MSLNEENIENWNKVRSEDKLALFDLYNNLYFHLYRFGINVYAESDTVKDCISQLFLKLWDKRSSLPEVKNVKSYLFTSLKRMIYDFVSSEEKVENYKLNQGENELSYEEIIIRTEEDEEIRKKLIQAIHKLTPTQLKLIKLKFYENYSYEQIAQITSQSKKTSYNTIYDAIKILKKILSEK